MKIGIFFDFERIGELVEKMGVVDGICEAKDVVMFAAYHMPLPYPIPGMLRIGIGDLLHSPL